jgi:ABC-2 type transport system ATP-binding protein
VTDFAIETTTLGKIYPATVRRNREIVALSDLSLCVPRGVKYGLLGANGAGKTTFVKILTSAVHATSGSATLLGKDARETEARRPIGYLPENHRFPTYFTGAGMLDFYSALSGVEPATRKQRIPELLELVGLKDWAQVRIKKYSKGMLQRLGLAQALIHRPQLLLLDEPTDGVDPVGRRDIRRILDTLTGTGVTVFLNSHLLSEVESFCDYVAILKRGRLVLEGQMSSLLDRSGYLITVSNLPEPALAGIRPFAAAVVPNGAKGADARRETGEQLIDPSRGALDPATVLRDSLNNQQVAFRAATREDANLLLDKIRSTGALVESMTASHSSLEDVFIEATK